MTSAGVGISPAAQDCLWKGQEDVQELAAQLSEALQEMVSNYADNLTQVQIESYEYFTRNWNSHNGPRLDKVFAAARAIGISPRELLSRLLDPR